MSGGRDKGAVTRGKFHGYGLLMRTVKGPGPERLSREVRSSGREESEGQPLED